MRRNQITKTKIKTEDIILILQNFFLQKDYKRVQWTIVPQQIV
jgi:hypothetical protein